MRRSQRPSKAGENLAQKRSYSESAKIVIKIKKAKFISNYITQI